MSVFLFLFLYFLVPILGSIFFFVDFSLSAFFVVVSGITAGFTNVVSLCNASKPKIYLSLFVLFSLPFFFLDQPMGLSFCFSCCVVCFLIGVFRLFFKNESTNVQRNSTGNFQITPISYIYSNHFDSIVKILDNYSSTSCSLIKDRPLSSSGIAAVLFTVADIAIISSNKNRSAASCEMAEQYFKRMSDFPPRNVLEEKLCERLEFFAEVVRGRPLRGECMPGIDLSEYNDNPVVRCAIAFVDCFMNPLFEEDYDSAPSEIYNAIDVVNINQKVLLPVIEDLTSLYNAIYAAPQTPLNVTP